MRWERKRGDRMTPRLLTPAIGRMVMPFNGVVNVAGRTDLRGGNQEFGFGRFEFKTPIFHANGEDEWQLEMQI